MSDIVVGVDGSATADEAARTAARLAEALGATLHVVTAYGRDDSEVITVGSDEFRSSSRDDALTTARRVAADIAPPGLEVVAEAVDGSPSDALIATARRLDATMIVVGNRRMQGIGRMLGSVPNSVAHNAPCDVYIVKTT
jgi:nucleotide-binding universal stress UspA family protein